MIGKSLKSRLRRVISILLISGFFSFKASVCQANPYYKNIKPIDITYILNLRNNEIKMLDEELLRTSVVQTFLYQIIHDRHVDKEMYKFIFEFISYAVKNPYFFERNVTFLNRSEEMYKKQFINKSEAEYIYLAANYYLKDLCIIFENRIALIDQIFGKQNSSFLSKNKPYSEQYKLHCTNASNQ